MKLKIFLLITVALSGFITGRETARPGTIEKTMVVTEYVNTPVDRPVCVTLPERYKKTHHAEIERLASALPARVLMPTKK